MDYLKIKCSFTSMEFLNEQNFNIFCQSINLLLNGLPSKKFKVMNDEPLLQSNTDEPVRKQITSVTQSMITTHVQDNYDTINNVLEVENLLVVINVEEGCPLPNNNVALHQTGFDLSENTNGLAYRLDNTLPTTNYGTPVMSKTDDTENEEMHSSNKNTAATAISTRTENDCITTKALGNTESLLSRNLSQSYHEIQKAENCLMKSNISFANNRKWPGSMDVTLKPPDVSTQMRTGRLQNISSPLKMFVSRTSLSGDFKMLSKENICNEASDTTRRPTSTISLKINESKSVHSSAKDIEQYAMQRYQLNNISNIESDILGKKSTVKGEINKATSSLASLETYNLLPVNDLQGDKKSNRPGGTIEVGMSLGRVSNSHEKSANYSQEPSCLPLATRRKARYKEYLQSNAILVALEAANKNGDRINTCANLSNDITFGQLDFVVNDKAGETGIQLSLISNYFGSTIEHVQENNFSSEYDSVRDETTKLKQRAVSSTEHHAKNFRDEQTSLNSAFVDQPQSALRDDYYQTHRPGAFENIQYRPQTPILDMGKFTEKGTSTSSYCETF